MDEISDSERLIIIMLCDIYKKQKITHNVDPDFIQRAIYTGNTWAIKHQYPGIFESSVDRLIVSEVFDTLSMWQTLEEAYATYSSEQKEQIKTASFGDNVVFLGYSGNEETNYISVTRFIIDHLNLFQHFKGRKLNSHLPLADTYRRMLSAFKPIQFSRNGTLTTEQMISTLKETIHPDNR